MRPIEPCRTFRVQEIEDEIERLKNVIVDPDLFRLFQNSWPSTLDTTVGWHGFSNATTVAADGTTKEGVKEELTFLITGDIEAMWLRGVSQHLPDAKCIRSKLKL